MVPRTAMALTVILLLVVGAAAWAIRHEGTYTIAANRLQYFPERVLDYQGYDERLDESVYAVLGNDYNLLRRYRHPSGRTVALYVGYYGTAKGGRPEHVPQYCYTGQGFAIEDWQNVPAPGRAGERIHQMIVKRQHERQLVLFWVHSHGDRVLADGLEQNLFRLRNRLVGDPDDGSLIRLSMPIVSDGDAVAIRELSRFAGEVIRLLPTHWPVEVRART